MIAKLTGRLDSSNGNWAVIDVNGVGYQVYCSARALKRLHASHDTLVSIDIVTYVRDHAIQLYGFDDPIERDCFCLLISLQGVGPKVALAILTSMTPESLHYAILSTDHTALSKAEGVGPKLAKRIVHELKDKIKDHPTTDTHPSDSDQPSDVQEEHEVALSALIHLGYTRTEAFTMIAEARRHSSPDVDAATLIRLSLQSRDTLS